jgi:hypothetical protein
MAARHTTRQATRRATWLATRFAPCLLGLALGLGLATAPALGASGPRSGIGRPFERGPIFLLGTASAGGTLEHSMLAPGYGASLLFRPLPASDLLGFLYDWNTGIVMQVDYRRVGSERHLLAADFILRRYVRNMRRDAWAASPFAGIGAGAAKITFPSGGMSDDLTWWTWVVEGGYELSPAEGKVVVLKAQWRLFRHGGEDYSGWEVQLGAGLPVPW